MNDFQIKLIAEYRENIEDLHKKFDKRKFYTQENIDESSQMITDPAGRKTIPIEVGDSYTEVDLPNSPKERLNLFVEYYVGCEFARWKIRYITNHDSWNMSELEREKQDLDAFIFEAKNPNPSHEEWFDKARKDEYLKFIEGYYETHLLDEKDIRLSALIYSQYVSYYWFLKEKILAIYMDGRFSKLSQINQIDKILKIICDNMETNIGYSNSDIRQILKNENLIISVNLLEEILHKLKKDEYIREIESPIIRDDGVRRTVLYYTASFEGRFFNNQRGYQNKLNHENADAERRNTETERNKYQYWISVSIAFSTGIAAIYYFLEIRQKHCGFYHSIYPFVLTALIALIPMAIVIFVFYSNRLYRDDWKKSNHK